jgi:hypothetical protein
MKTSSKKVAANRRNAQHSTGPRTPEGRAASSRNAFRHGLSAMTLTVMPGESQQDLDQLSETIRNEWKPSGDHENYLTDQMISARWRLERLARWEAEAIDDAIEPPQFVSEDSVRRWEAKSADRHVLNAMRQTNSIFDKLERYTRAAERAYSKAVKDLQEHRATAARIAKQNEATAKQNEAKAAEEWLQAELRKSAERGAPDPLAGLWEAEPYTPDPVLAPAQESK